MIENWVLLVPLVYIILFIIGAILNSIFAWFLEDTLFGIICVILLIICLLWFAIAMIDTITGIVNEPIMFAQRQTEYKTITNFLAVSNDVINTDLYLRALDYNSLVVKTQEQIHNPAYSIMTHFLKCDWDSLPLIVIN